VSVSFLRSNSLIWIFLKKLLKKLNNLFTALLQLLPFKIIFPNFDSIKDLLGSLPWERWWASQQNIQYNSERPNITFVCVFLVFKYFWGNVIRSTKFPPHDLFITTKSKINESNWLDIPLVHQKDILWFNISMTQLRHTMAVVDSAEQLLHYHRCFILCQIPLFLDVVEKLSSLTFFQN